MDRIAKLVIAVVDDDSRVRESLASLMESAGFTARVFSLAREFLQEDFLARTTCLITDVRMPGMNGLDLQRCVRLERPDLPIIFITAHGDAKMRIQAMRDGAVEFLTKPFDNAVLLETVHVAVEDHAKALELGDSNQ